MTKEGPLCITRPRPQKNVSFVEYNKYLCKQNQGGELSGKIKDNVVTLLNVFCAVGPSDTQERA